MSFEILTREMIEKREYDLLAPYAMKSAESLGRVHEEEEHQYRSKYQRDKDRIIYSTAFRRLEYKTQVFVNHEGDYYRTRMTHTLEVAQIARTIARALRLNEDLIEALALAHDLGHTPFGHAGEDTLAELMKDHGGFDHNSHGLRVVDILEDQYPSFSGLNLSSEIRRGIIRHSTPFDIKRMGDEDIPGIDLLEIQVVDIADEIAYDNHDIDDGLKSELLDETDLADIPMWGNMVKEVGSLSARTARGQIVRNLINLQVSDVISNTLKKVDELKIESPSDLGRVSGKVVFFSDEMNTQRAPLRELLYEKLYRHYRVVRMSDKASRFLTSLFNIYLKNPDQLPPSTRSKIKERGEYRTICDYVAGMTDRYALDQYKKFFEPYERV